MPDARYAALDAQYAKEQDELSGEINGLEKAISGFEQSKKSAEKFIAWRHGRKRNAKTGCTRTIYGTSGKQKGYEDRIKTEKRRKMEAKKAALRAEDMAKGVFYIAGSVLPQGPQKGLLPARVAVD